MRRTINRLFNYENRYVYRDIYSRYGDNVSHYLTYAIFDTKNHHSERIVVQHNNEDEIRIMAKRLNDDYYLYNEMVHEYVVSIGKQLEFNFT